MDEKYFEQNNLKIPDDIKKILMMEANSYIGKNVETGQEPDLSEIPENYWQLFYEYYLFEKQLETEKKKKPEHLIKCDEIKSKVDVIRNGFDKNKTLAEINRDIMREFIIMLENKLIGLHGVMKAKEKEERKSVQENIARPEIRA